jgi:DNA polymerase-3 subunit delta'
VDYVSADALPWLAEPQQRLRAARAAGRLPQAVLLLSVPGLGALHFANWLAALTLCESQVAAPCGTCPSCALLRAASHPDYHVVRLEEKAKQIKVLQIRELIDSLALTSYRGGFKVATVEGAEALNANSANAFLKTLEEPSGATLLILSASWTHRLPATILSRCQRIALRAPPADAARAWLETHGSPAANRDANWPAALALAAGAPLSALELDAGVIAALEREMNDGIRAIAADAVDLTLLAERWVKSDLGLRLLWLENWIARRVYASLAGDVRLPQASHKAKIRSLFALLDASRELRRATSTGMNQQLALEALLLGGRAALAA